MNLKSLPILRAAAFASALFVTTAIASAQDRTPADPVAQMLATTGIVPVKAAGPYVQIGSYRIHVLVRLGRPYATLPNGTLLYRGFATDDGAGAPGTLVVRFVRGQVSELSLVSPAVVAAMLNSKAGGKSLLASR